MKDIYDPFPYLNPQHIKTKKMKTRVEHLVANTDAPLNAPYRLDDKEEERRLPQKRQRRGDCVRGRGIARPKVRQNHECCSHLCKQHPPSAPTGEVDYTLEFPIQNEAKVLIPMWRKNQCLVTKICTKNN